MAAASKSTKRSSNDPRRAISEAREDIKLTFDRSQKFLTDKLEKLTRKADDISEKPQAEDNEIKEIEEKVKKIQEKAKSHLQPLQAKSKSTSDALDDKKKTKSTDDQSPKDDYWPTLDMELEKILENAATKYKLADYKKLNGSLKNCLLCLAIFPQDAIIQKRTLIYWWIGEGIVNAMADHTAENVGEEYFQKLLDGCWIDPVNNKSSKNVHEFKMDPWVRWLVIYLARDEGFFNLDNTGMPDSSPSNCPRDCLLKKNEKQPPIQPNQEGLTRGHPKISLLSVFNVNAERLRAQDLFSKYKDMKTLLVLHLGRWQTSAERHIEFVDEDSEFLDFWHKLSLPKRLRYLSFAGISRLTELPTSVKNLSHLKILDLRSCQNLERLGEEIIFLKSLTHLDVSECYMLDHMPNGLSSLLQLEVLKGFIFGSVRSKDPCQLAELAKLKRLRKLSISVGGEAKIQPMEMTKLKEINGLQSLAITWGMLSPTLPEADRITLKENWTKLSYPPNLEKLDLRCFPEDTVLLDPSLERLKKLYIRGGKVENINIEDEINTQMKVEMIRLKFLKNLSKNWPELAERFPLLNYLEIHNCPNLKAIPELDKDNVWMADGKPVATDNVPTSTDTSVGSQTTEADGATTTSSPPTETISLPTSTSKTPKSSLLDTTEIVGPTDIPDRASIPTDNSSSTTNITSSSPTPAAASGLAHSTSTTPTPSSLATSAAVGPSAIPSSTSTDTSSPSSAIQNEDTTLTGTPDTSSSQTPPHPTSPTADAAHDTPTDRASIPTDNSPPTTNITSSSPTPAAPSGLARSTSTTPTPSALATSAAGGSSAIPDIPSSISTDTSSHTPAIQNENTTLTTTPDTSSSQTPPHPTIPTADAAHDTPTPTSPSSSLSSLDKGHTVADSTFITPTSSPVAENNASIPTTLLVHDQDTSAPAIDTAVNNPPGERVLASTHIDSPRIASSATQEAPDICPSLPTMTDSTVSTTFSKTVSAPDAVKDSSPENLSATATATTTGTAASPS